MRFEDDDEYENELVNEYENEFKHKPKGNKGLVIAIIVVLLLIAAVIGGYFYLQNNNKQATVLQREATKIADTDLLKDDIDMKIKTTGKYAVVEETVKEYLNNAKNTYKELMECCSDKEVANILTKENITADEKKLSVVKQKVEEYGTKLENLGKQAENIAEEDTINKAIEEKHLRNYYDDIYKNIMHNEKIKLELKTIEQKIKEETELVAKKIEALKKAVDYLKENERYWELEKGKIQFTNVYKLSQYYQLLNDYE